MSPRRTPPHRRIVALQAGLLLLLASVTATPGSAQFLVTNLVSDQPGVAMVTDPGLLNAWGVSFAPTSPFWVSSNGAGVSNLYRVDPTTNVPVKQGLIVKIPGDGSVTGQVFNPTAATGAFNGDLFLFVSEDGTISGWRGALGTNAEVLAVGSANNAYKGSALGVVSGHTYLYAANFKSGTIDVFKGDAGAPDLPGSFVDPALPAGFAPFNVQRLGNTIYVTYALVGPDGDDLAGAGNGFVDAFDLQGNFIGRVATQGTLNSPWGLALAPTSFGSFAGDLLVGNFGDGTINAFDPATNAFLGQLTDLSGAPLSIDGLWALTIGNGGNGGSPNKLYFSAGPGDEAHGLFGVVQAVPEPSAWALLSGLAVPAAMLLKRRAS